MESQLARAKHVHVVGIGGIGVSAVARMLLVEGKSVSGSDQSDSPVIASLRKLGAEVHIGQSAGQIPRATDLLIYSNAVSPQNPERLEGEKRNIPSLSYPEALALISKEKKTIAVAGTHGKTTTSAMVAKVLIDAGLFPTVIVGSILRDFGSNFVAGGGEYFVVEADEYRRQFLHLSPYILAVTNIEADHLDYFKDLDDVIGAFAELAAKLPEEGYLVCDPKAPNLKKVIESTRAKVIDYTSLLNSEFRLKVIGEHNRKNAAVALAIAEITSVAGEKARKSLEAFSGTWRRFEYKGKTERGAEVYDDYGHHPTEIQVTLDGARKHFGSRRIILVFQPHQYNRLKTLFGDFARSFAAADEALILPVVQIREEKDPSVSSEMLVEAANKHKRNARFVETYADAVNILESEAQEGDVVLTMGATEVYKVGELLLGK